MSSKKNNQNIPKYLQDRESNPNKSQQKMEVNLLITMLGTGTSFLG